MPEVSDFCSAPQHGEATEHCEFNANIDSVEDSDSFPYLEQVQYLTD